MSLCSLGMTSANPMTLVRGTAWSIQIIARRPVRYGEMKGNSVIERLGRFWTMKSHILIYTLKYYSWYCKMARGEAGGVARRHPSSPDKINIWWYLVLGDSRVVGGEESGLGFMTKVEPTGFAKGFDMLCEGEQKRAKDESKVKCLFMFSWLFACWGCIRGFLFIYISSLVPLRILILLIHSTITVNQALGQTLLI